MKLEQAKLNPYFDQEEYDYLMKIYSLGERKAVTQATERRVNKILRAGGEFAEIIGMLWERLREDNYFYDNMFRGCKTSVKQLREMGLIFDNNVQIRVPKRQYGAEATAMSVLFNETFSYWQTLDMSTINVQDFNAFIKAVYEHEAENGRL